MSDAIDTYFTTINRVLADVQRTQVGAVEDAAQLCADAIADDHLVHTFGSGHSRIIVEEVWPRYGSFPGFHPIVELSLTSYHSVAGANGQRQAMFLENVPGLAAQIAQNFVFRPGDVLLAVSSGGTSVVTVEFAECLRAQGVKIIAITSMAHSQISTAKALSGKRLFEVADVVLDTCTPIGDAAVDIPGWRGPVGPTTTIAGAALANALKVRVAELLSDRNVVLPVLASPLIVGAEESAADFEAGYDEHRRRVARLYAR